MDSRLYLRFSLSRIKIAVCLMAPSGIPIPGVFFVQRPSGPPGWDAVLFHGLLCWKTLATTVSLHIDGVFACECFCIVEYSDEDMGRRLCVRVSYSWPFCGLDWIELFVVCYISTEIVDLIFHSELNA